MNFEQMKCWPDCKTYLAFLLRDRDWERVAIIQEHSDTSSFSSMWPGLQREGRSSRFASHFKKTGRFHQQSGTYLAGGWDSCCITWTNHTMVQDIKVNPGKCMKNMLRRGITLAHKHSAFGGNPSHELKVLSTVFQGRFNTRKFKLVGAAVRHRCALSWQPRKCTSKV